MGMIDDFWGNLREVGEFAGAALAWLASEPIACTVELFGEQKTADKLRETFENTGIAIGGAIAGGIIRPVEVFTDLGQAIACSIDGKELEADKRFAQCMEKGLIMIVMPLLPDIIPEIDITGSNSSGTSGPTPSA